MVEIVDLTLRTVIKSSEIYTIYSSIKKKLKTNFIMSTVLFRVSQPKRNEIIIKILLLYYY